MEKAPKILLLTTFKTGNGHLSSANTMEKAFGGGYDFVKYPAVPLLGFIGRFMDENYVRLTTTAPFLYRVGWQVSEWVPRFFGFCVYLISRKKIRKLLEDEKPDVLISNHPVLTTGISRTLKKYGFRFPFVITVLDIDPPKTWFDRDADLIFVLSEKVREDYLKRGMPEDRVVVSGFQIREEIRPCAEAKKIDGKINILMVNPALRTRKNIRFLKETVAIPNTRITFICGQNERLYRRLIALKETDPALRDVTVLGHVDDMNRYLSEAHLVLGKAGPGVIAESVKAGCAFVVTGHISGQESHNYRFVEENGFGIRCEDPRKIRPAILRMIENGDLSKTLSNALSFRDYDGGRIVAETVKDRFLKIDDNGEAPR